MLVHVPLGNGLRVAVTSSPTVSKIIEFLLCVLLLWCAVWLDLTVCFTCEGLRVDGDHISLTEPDEHESGGPEHIGRDLLQWAAAGQLNDLEELECGVGHLVLQDRVDGKN